MAKLELNLSQLNKIYLEMQTKGQTSSEVGGVKIHVKEVSPPGIVKGTLTSQKSSQ
ncbi:hypothetical protein HYX12_01505 [Candidatus Woesearchaeota archaeon]|nr:hypothetical protein [Candidatus Woesearchaeota archaeon]